MVSMTWLSLAPGAHSLSVSIVLDLWTLPLSSRKLSVNENSPEENDTTICKNVNMHNLFVFCLHHLTLAWNIIVHDHIVLSIATFSSLPYITPWNILESVCMIILSFNFLV